MTASAAIARRPHHRTPVQNLRCLTCKANRRHKPPLQRAKVIDFGSAASHRPADDRLAIDQERFGLKSLAFGSAESFPLRVQPQLQGCSSSFMARPAEPFFACSLA